MNEPSDLAEKVERFRRMIDLFIDAGRTHVPVNIDDLRIILDALEKTGQTSETVPA